MDNENSVLVDKITIKTIDGEEVLVNAGDGKPFSSSVRCVEIVQQERFGFNENLIQQILDGFDNVKRYSYLRHDKDRQENGSFKPPHWHLVLDFKNPQPMKTLLKRFQRDGVYITFNQFEKCKDGFEGAVTYQTHRNAPEKFQYDSSAVVCNFDYDELADKYIEKHADTDLLARLLKSIAAGEVLEYNIADVVDVSFYTMFKRKIDDAFEYRSRISVKQQRNMSVIYIHGSAGSGKTLSAQKLAVDFFGYSPKQVYVSSSGKDWIDGYMNEPVFILDDFRPKGTSVPKFLKALDNYCNSRIDSRYRSKNFSECKLLFITSVIPFDSIWNNLDQSDFDNENVSLSEARKQLERRLSAHIEVEGDKLFYEENIAPFNRYILPNPAWEEVQARRAGTSLTQAQQMFREKLCSLGVDPVDDSSIWAAGFTFRKASPADGFISDAKMSSQMQLIFNDIC